jgi:PAS domain S-box-containing protein
MIEASVDCVITIDAQSTILEFNAAAERTFGYARAEVIGKPLPEMIIPPSLREAHRRGMAALLKGGTGKLLGRRVEMPAMRADSSEFPVELTITRIASQKPPLFTAYLRDITERKRAEEALRKSEKLFTAFMDHLPGYAWIKDVEGRYVYINETFRQLASAMGKTDAELWPAEIASTYRANDNQVIQTKNTLQTIEPFPKDPEHGCQIVSKFPIFDQDGAVVMVGGASVDISKLVQAEKARDAQALRYKTLMETSADSIYVVDAEGNLQEANAAFLRQRGYTAAEVQGLNVADWDARWTRAQLQKRYRKLVGSSAVFETRHRSKDGSLFDVEVSATSVRIGGKQLFFCVARDITGRKKADRALRESETRFRQLVENLDEVFWISDLEGSTTIYVSPAYERIWGRSCESLYAEPKSWRDAIHPEDRPRMEATFAADPGSTGDNIYRIVRPDGSVRWIHDRGCPVQDENGNVVRFAGIAEDITERQKAEETTAQLAAIVRSSSDAIIGLDLNGVIISWNQGAERIFAYGAEEMVGGSIRRLIPADRREEEEQVFSRIRQGENVEHFETAGIEKGGSQIDLSVTVSPIRNAAGDMVGASLVARDITGLKRTQEALRTSEERFRELAENIHEVFWMSDPENTRMIYISPAYESIWGRTRETLYASPASWTEAIHPEDKERMVRARAHFAEGMPHDNTYRIVRPDGSIRWIRDRGFPVRDEHGVVVRFAGIAEDISERRQAEEKLKQSESQLAQAQRLAHVGSWSLDLGSNTVTWSDELYRMFGVEPSEFDHRYEAVIDTTHPEDRDLLRSIIENAVKTREPFSAYYRMTRADGEVRVLHSHGAVVTDEDGNVRTMYGAAQDVTERKEAEERLRRSEEKFKALFDLAPVGIAVLDRQRNVLDANPALAQITRLPREELLRGGALRRTILNADGTPMPPHEFPSARALRENRPISNLETGIVLENGETVWLQVSASPLALSDMSAVVVTQDITERKRAEEELKREKEILAKIFNNIPVMIGFVGTDGSVRLVNPEWVRTIGWTLEELRDQKVDIFAEAYPDLSYRQEVLDFVAAATGDWADLKIKVRGGRVLDVACAVVHLSDGTKVAIAQDITERKRAAEQLEEANRQLRILSRQLFHIQEEERRHLARELHDEIGQTLTAAKINLSSIETAAGEMVTSRVDETITLLDNLLRQVRQISLDLHPSLLDDLGLVPALRSLLDQQAHRAGLRTQFYTAEPFENLGAETQIVGFRIAQEAITNVLRHAGAQQISVHLHTKAGRLEMRIIDDGTGFDLAEGERHAHEGLGFGLMGMRERAAIVGGRVEIISSPSAGTTVEVSLPLNGSGKDHIR